MTKEQFLFQLEQRLLDIPEDERAEAMGYYRDYFDDAGEENEEQVIAELGSPDKVASSIKDGLRGKRSEGATVGQPPQMRGAYDSGKRTDKRSKWILILLAAVITFPVWIGAVGVLFGVLVAVLVTAIALVVVDIVLTIAGIIGGIVCLATGMVRLFTGGLVSGLMMFGAGLLLIALGCLCLVVLLLLCGKLFPWMLNGISNLMHNGSKRRKRVSVNE